MFVEHQSGPDAQSSQVFRFREIMVVLSNSDEPRASSAHAMWFRGSSIRADDF
jgi:hypothetical protein